MLWFVHCNERVAIAPLWFLFRDKPLDVDRLTGVTEIEGAGPGGLAGVLLVNRGRLRAYLLARGAGDAADDILQEMWIKASAIDREVEPNPLSYLFRMAERLLLDTMRQSMRRSVREAGWAEANDANVVPSAERTMIAREQVGLASRRLGDLGERVQHVFRRYRLEGAEQRHIAEELGVSLSTVEKDLRKAYVALLEIRGNENAD